MILNEYTTPEGYSATVHHSGLELSTIIRGVYLHKLFIGYDTLEECIEEFQAYLMREVRSIEPD